MDERGGVASSSTDICDWWVAMILRGCRRGPDTVLVNVPSTLPARIVQHVDAHLPRRMGWKTRCSICSCWSFTGQDTTSLQTLEGSSILTGPLRSLRHYIIGRGAPCHCRVPQSAGLLPPAPPARFPRKNRLRPVPRLPCSRLHHRGGTSIPAPQRKFSWLRKFWPPSTCCCLFWPRRGGAIVQHVYLGRGEGVIVQTVVCMFFWPRRGGWKTRCSICCWCWSFTGRQRTARRHRLAFARWGQPPVGTASPSPVGDNPPRLTQTALGFCGQLSLCLPPLFCLCSPQLLALVVVLLLLFSRFPLLLWKLFY